MNKDDKWPTLRDVFPRRVTDRAAEQRLQEAGFGLPGPLNRQSPPGRGDKNYEGQHPQELQGDPTMTTQAPPNFPPAGPPVSPTVVQQVEALRSQGFTVGIPMTVQFDQSVLDAMRRGPAPLPIGQDLARFGAKAAVAGVTALVVGVAYHYITKPDEMVTGM